MTVKLGIILLGAMLIYAGWTNRDVRSMLQGDNTVGKASSSWTPSSSSPGGTSGGTSAAAPSQTSGGGASAANPQTQRNVNTG